MPVASILLFGPQGSGKTTIAARLAANSAFPFVKVISPEDLVGKSDYYRTNHIIKCFDDAYKSRRSIVLLDDVERLAEYVEVGRRFNNNVLQALLVYVKKRPIKDEHTIAIIATSSNVDFLKDFGLMSQFNVKLEVPELCFSSNGQNEIAMALQ